MINVLMNYQHAPVRDARFRGIGDAVRKIMRLCWGMVFLLPALAHQAQGDPLSAAEDSPQRAMEIVRETSERLLASIEKEELDPNKDQKRLYELANALVFDKFDFRRMSSRVLGKNWRGATAEEKDRFIEQFKAYLVITYAGAWKEYDGQEIEYLPMKPGKSPTRTEVRTRVQLRGKRPIEVDYRFSRARSETWKVVDVLVAGVSLVLTHRSSFQADIDRMGISGLIEKLKRNNDRILSPNPS
uniref:Phospholipid transport system substrate-binding protein n=1 Tax=Candidatus Kentrum sp. SD TaxID=2126332 RepID=A0A451BHF0_9GAMM|nr:MAG: phospholipid transport system substrate-binding protein [Candidatus Kentron sp. SD]VFK47628.1 MAG: phospholipid transport system substrate-binding protein [Candidatus Kentron sp. SD]VFK77711.1 MAG: phospholipid transport system substrate-binding protein [Candidatus Kentron sp. SD]